MGKHKSTTTAKTIHQKKHGTTKLAPNVSECPMEYSPKNVLAPPCPSTYSAFKAVRKRRANSSSTGPHRSLDDLIPGCHRDDRMEFQL